MLMSHLPSDLTLQELVDWIEKLPDNDESYRRDTYQFNEAVRGIIAYGTSASEILIDHLINTENSWMQWASIWVLSELGDRKAIDALWMVFHKTKHHLGIQHHALIALSGFKDDRVYEVLIPLLKHPYLRDTAITSLGRLGNPQAVELLLPMLHDIHEESRPSTASELGNLEAVDTSKPLTTQLTKASIDEKKLIIASLAKIGSEKAMGELKAVINAKDIESNYSSQFDRLRCDAVDAIACIDHPDTIPTLQAFLNHPKQGVRRHTRKALSQLLPES